MTHSGSTACRCATPRTAASSWMLSISPFSRPASRLQTMQGLGAGAAGGPQRAAKRGLHAALDGAGQGGPGGAGPGRGDGQAAGAEPSPSPTSRVRFDPVVKVEPQQGGGGGSQQKDPGHLAQPAHAWLLGKYASYAGPGALQPECACRKKFDAQHQGSIGPHAR